MWEYILHRKWKIEYPAQYILLGQTYFLKGNINKAIKAYQKALRMDTSKSNGHLFLANAWFKKAAEYSDIGSKNRVKCLHKAIVHYSKAEKLSPLSVIGEWAGKQLKNAGEELMANEYASLLKKVNGDQ